jgi:sugar phosphate isomerase/epimerase
LKLSDYSLNYSSLIVRGQTDVFGFLRLCRGMCLEGASLHLRDLPDARLETLARVRRAYLDQGLSLAAVTMSTDFGQSVDGLDAELDRARAGIQAASYLGAPLLRVFAGSAPPQDRQAAWTRSVRCVRQVCQEAARVGLPIGLQNHNHGGLCGSGAALRRFVDEVRHPNLTVVLDCGQFVGSPGASGSSGKRSSAVELLASVREVASLARHVRVKFYRPGPDGDEPSLPYDRIFEILQSVHYPGFLDIVYEPSPGGEDVRAAVPRIADFLRSKIAPSLPRFKERS